jgi:hypothetical protein
MLFKLFNRIAMTTAPIVCAAHISCCSVEDLLVLRVDGVLPPTSILRGAHITMLTLSQLRPIEFLLAARGEHRRVTPLPVARCSLHVHFTLNFYVHYALYTFTTFTSLTTTPSLRLGPTFSRTTQFVSLLGLLNSILIHSLVNYQPGCTHRFTDHLAWTTCNKSCTSTLSSPHSLLPSP